MNHLEKIARIVKRLEERIYASSISQMGRLSSVIEKAADEIETLTNREEDIKIPDRKTPDFLPPRDDMKVRFKKEDIRKEDKTDYRDTLFDKDLEG